ncbi:unnamed protein product [Prunus armeniaca]|uniref:Alliinase EGF-like domain-containing protein n=1 Tax=Prunus armeniaca TaxID=36596 RepID=A0A6J5V977_PRUAR|nr:unnamed protein product [Prunus armeniaca]
MAKPLSSYLVCLAFSLVFNLLLIFKLYVGHGRAYLDGLTRDGNVPVCECHSCYGGPQCSEFLTGCAANADSGDPYFLEPFWMQHASKSALVVAGWHRMSYTFADQSYISAELERHIRKLHAIVGNAVTGGRYIVFGAGSTPTSQCCSSCTVFP